MKHQFKSLKTLLAVMLATIGLSLSACGEGNNNDKSEEPDTWATSYVVNITFKPDFLEVAEITAHIANPDGSFSEEKILTQSTSWSLKGNKIPDKAGVLFTFVPRADIDPDRVYNLGISGTIKCSSYKNSDVFSYLGTSVGPDNMPVKGDRVAEYLTKERVTMVYGVNAEGTVVEVNSKTFDFGLNGVLE